jgi:multicomponent Na+:H+ antiporter subunit D
MSAVALSALVPMLVACAMAGASAFTRRREGAVALAGALATLALTVVVLSRDEPRTLVWFGGWEPRDGVAVGVAFAVDGVGAGLAVFVAVLGVVSLVIAARVIRVEDAIFDALMLVFIGAMVGFCLTGDLFNLFVFFELMSIAAYVLVGYEVRRRAALEGALTFAVTNTVGSILLLLGIALLYGRTGALNLAQMGRALAGGPADGLVVVAFALVACGLFVKAAVVPFHLWTADAYAVAPTPVCILLAGAFSELGLYGIARVYWTVFDGALGSHAGELRAVLVGVGVLTAVLGALLCAAQHHLKRMLAFATIAQVGLFLVGVGLLSADGAAGSAVWIVADGFVKAALFGCVALVQHRHGVLEEADLHGQARGLRPVGVVFVLGALMVASLPFTGSFVGRSLVEDAALKADGYGWVPAVMLVVTALVSGTLLRAAARVFWGVGARAPRDPAGDEPDEEQTDREAADRSRTSVLLWPPAAMVAAAAAWGLLPGVVDAAGRAAAAFVDGRGYAAAVLDGRVTRVAPPELADPGLTAYLYALGSLALAVAIAAAALARTPAVPAPLRAGVDALRRVHNGRPGDYVAWTVAGAATLGGVFAVTLL